MSKRKKKSSKKKSPKKKRVKGIYLAIHAGKQRPVHIKRVKAESPEYRDYRMSLVALWFYAAETKKGGNRSDEARKLIKAGKLKPIFQSGPLPKRYRHKKEATEKQVFEESTPAEKKRVLATAMRLVKEREEVKAMNGKSKKSKKSEKTKGKKKSKKKGTKKKSDKKKSAKSYYEPVKPKPAPEINLNGKAKKAMEAAITALQETDTTANIINPGKIRKMRKAAIAKLEEALEIAGGE